jgi:hypothetical protein
MATICPNCKNEISSASIFCEHCGHRVQNAAEGNVAVERQPYRQYQNIIKDKTEKKPHQSVDSKTLKMLLSHLEQGRGRNFEEAKAKLMEMRSLEAVEPLWKLSQKAFGKDEAKKAAKEILTETGSDKLVDLIIGKNLYDEEELVWAISILADEKQERSIEWLADNTKLKEFTVELCALEAIRRIGSKKSIPYLVKNASCYYLEDSVSPVRGNLLLTAAMGIALATKQSIDRDLAASLLTAPFLPIEMVVNAPKLVQKAQIFIYRIDVITEIIQSVGFEELDKIFYEPQFMKSISKSNRMEIESTIASCYLRLGKHHPNIQTVIQNVIYKKKLSFGDEISAAILTDEMIRFNITQKSDLYLEPIRASLKDKGKITRQSSIASVFYQNYKPCLQEALQEAKIKDNRFVPALSYCAYMHDSIDAKNTLDYLEGSGNTKIKYAIGNWKEILAEWKNNEA